LRLTRPKRITQMGDYRRSERVQTSGTIGTWLHEHVGVRVAEEGKARQASHSGSKPEDEGRPIMEHCSIGFHVKPTRLQALEAAHIKPVKEGGQHETTNGILLRSDLHKLFDRVYVTVTPDHRCRVSHRLKEDFHNGEEYMQLAGTELWVPHAAEDRPRREFFEWHADTLFKG